MFDLGYWMGAEPLALPIEQKPNLITGVGRMRIRGRDKTPANEGQKRKAARKMTKQSRRRNRK